MINNRKPSIIHRIYSILGIVLLVIFIPVLICNLVLIIKSTVNPNKVPDFLGFKPFVVVSGSMEETILINDLIVTKKCDPSTLKTGYNNGDIVAFKNNNTVITHRLIQKKNIDGEPVFISKGDTNSTADMEPVSYKMIEGKYLFRIPRLGGLALFMQTPLGMLIFIFVPIAILLLYDVTRRRYFEIKSKEEEASK